MSAPLGIPTSNTDRWTLTRYDRKSNLVTGFVCLDPLNTSTYLVSLSCVAVILVVEEIDVFQMMGPDAE